ncbi:hypothetical protein ACDI16_15220 [Oceanobacillus caeni]
MTLLEVLEKLNNKKPLAEVASMAGIAPKDLERKLASAAIEYDKEDERYKYKGTALKESLRREVDKRIVVLNVDAPFVKKKVGNRKGKNTAKNIDIEYIMFKDYQKVNQSLLKEKKTFFLTEEMYSTIKTLSTSKSFRINAILNILLEKGLEYYKLDIND